MRMENSMRIRNFASGLLRVVTVMNLRARVLFLKPEKGDAERDRGFEGSDGGFDGAARGTYGGIFYLP
ncbi:MAG: hypothetical protein QW634_03010, partial [Candidatus Korarchaeum sp.]